MGRGSLQCRIHLSCAFHARFVRQSNFEIKRVAQMLITGVLQLSRDNLRVFAHPVCVTPQEANVGCLGLPVSLLLDVAIRRKFHLHG